MKQDRIAAASLAAVFSPPAVWSPLAGFAVSLATPLPARGGDVPFTEHPVSTTAGGATSVYAADVDRDGDTDVLSASFNDNKIAWYENTGPCGFDADCDGDVDVHDFAAFQLAFTGPQ